MEKRKCHSCQKDIDTKKDHYVLLSTYNRSNSPDDHAYLHFSCWTEYFNRCVINKSRWVIQGMQEKAMGLFNSPMIQNLIGGTKAGDLLGNMLNRDLSEKKVHTMFIPKIKVIKQIQNDRKKRSAKKNKVSKV